MLVKLADDLWVNPDDVSQVFSDKSGTHLRLKNGNQWTWKTFPVNELATLINSADSNLQAEVDKIIELSMAAINQREAAKAAAKARADEFHDKIALLEAELSGNKALAEKK